MNTMPTALLAALDLDDMPSHSQPVPMAARPSVFAAFVPMQHRHRSPLTISTTAPAKESPGPRTAPASNARQLFPSKTDKADKSQLLSPVQQFGEKFKRNNAHQRNKSVATEYFDHPSAGADDDIKSPETPRDKKLSLYKTELCRTWEETGVCRYGPKCQFAHSGTELRTIDRHPKYKTEMCKTFWERGTCPYGKRCCFIHTDRTDFEESQNEKFPSFLPF